MKRGATLAEILVVCGLLLLLIGLLAPVLWLTSRFARSAQAGESAQSEALTLVYRLQHDYRCSLPGSLTAETRVENTQLSFLSFEPAVGEDALWSRQGQVLWKKWVQYRFLPGAGRVERREVGLVTPNPKPDMRVPLWPAGQKGQALAFHVTQFEVVLPPPDSPLLRVRLATQVEAVVSGSEVRVLPRFYQCDTL